MSPVLHNWQQTSRFHLFLLLYNILWVYISTTISSFLPLSFDIYVFSISWLLYLVLHWTKLCTQLPFQFFVFLGCMPRSISYEFQVIWSSSLHFWKNSPHCFPQRTWSREHFHNSRRTFLVHHIPADTVVVCLFDIFYCHSIRSYLTVVFICEPLITCGNLVL